MQPDELPPLPPTSGPSPIDYIRLPQLIRLRFIESVLATSRYLNPNDICRVFEVRGTAVATDIRLYKTLNPGIVWKRKGRRYMASCFFKPAKGLMPRGVTHEAYLAGLESVIGKQMVAGPQ